MSLRRAVAFISSILFFCCCIVPVSVQGETPETQEFYYIYNNPCETCHEFEEFAEEFQVAAGEGSSVSQAKVTGLNLIHSSAREQFRDLCEQFDVPEDDRLAPMLLSKDGYLLGRENIHAGMADLIAGAAVSPERMQDSAQTVLGKEADELKLDFSDSDSVVLYFGTIACESCEEVQAFLKTLPAHLVVSHEGEEIDSKLFIRRYSITNEEDLELFYSLLERYEVPDSKRVVPIVFMQGGYLSGSEEITGQLARWLAGGEALFFSDDSIGTDTPQLTLQDLPGILTAGFVNGLNPCSISMLFLLLSLLVSRRENILKLGFTYIISKMTAYFVIGIGFYSLLQFLEHAIFARIQFGVSIVIAVAAFAAALLNLMDFCNIRRQEYGKVVVQLPKKVRKLDHSIMKKMLDNAPVKLVIPIVFLLGLVISAGEFLCTGQVYLATILYLIRTTEALDPFLLLTFLGYVLAMAAPAVILVVLCQKGKQVIRLSEWFRGHMDKVKLLTAAVFVLFGILVLVM